MTKYTLDTYPFLESVTDENGIFYKVNDKIEYNNDLRGYISGTILKILNKNQVLIVSQIKTVTKSYQICKLEQIKHTQKFTEDLLYNSESEKIFDIRYMLYGNNFISSF